jgi:DNA-binding HxlR family transcriptional regulator
MHLILSSDMLRTMRSYKQYCGLARGLDVVGDRWVLLIVRELLEGPRRYNELLDGLPGIATNLLAERLRSLEDAGVLMRGDDNGYALTEWGMGLHDVVYALGRWARPLMGRMAHDDEFRSHWITHPIHLLYEGVDKSRPRLTVEVDTGDAPMTVASAAGRVTVSSGRPARPDLVVSGPPDGVVGLLAGRVSRAEAARRGVTVNGDARKLSKLRPRSGAGPTRSAGVPLK